jgi:transcriptional regulator with XRE-family HTH domain
MSMAQTLRQSMTLWVDEKESRSISMLCRLSKVSYSTLRRIMQGEEHTPSAETALKIADIVMTTSELSSFATQYMPMLAKTRTDIAYKSDAGALGYCNRDYIPILLLSSHSKGTNEDEVRNFFGLEMTYKFQELVDSGLLVRASGSNWKLEKDLGSVDLDTTRELLSAMANLCPSANDSVPRSSLAHIGWESVNFETALAVYHAALDFARIAISLTSKKENKGDVLIMFGSLFNVLKGVEAYK